MGIEVRAQAASERFVPPGGRWWKEKKVDGLDLDPRDYRVKSSRSLFCGTAVDLSARARGGEAMPGPGVSPAGTMRLCTSREKGTVRSSSPRDPHRLRPNQTGSNQIKPCNLRCFSQAQPHANRISPTIQVPRSRAVGRPVAPRSEWGFSPSAAGSRFSPLRASSGKSLLKLSKTKSNQIKPNKASKLTLFPDPASRHSPVQTPLR
jgi:hypothetical protein